MTRRRHRSLAVLALAAFMAVLTGCTSLPVSGEVNVGLALDEADLDPDISQIAARPLAGASPGEIVEGFLDAALTPDNGWAIAREFLNPELAATWRPSESVTIDSGAGAREFTVDLDEEGDAAVSGDVRVLLDHQVARVDEDGAYAELPGDASVAAFKVARNEDGEWRITAAADGIVLDAETFPQVFRRYSLQYFDQSWTHLVPDLRWYPRRQTIATTLTQSLLSGEPSEWLAPAVRSAFPGDVALASDSVPISPEKVATVELTAAAATLDATQLSRMRTQLEATLRPAGVTEARLLVNGRDLDAGRTVVDAGRQETSPVVLTGNEFGAYVGDEIVPVDGISDEIVALAPSVTSVDVAADDARAAVKLDSGLVYTVSDGRRDELDGRPGLIAPSMDPYGYTWSVPSASPHAVKAWRPDVTGVDVAGAFPEASSIAQLRVAADGVRAAAVVTIGSQRWLVLSAIVRDEAAEPVELGPMHMVAQIEGSVLGMSWVGGDSLAVLVDDAQARLVLTQDVGGPGTYAAAPTGARALSGGRTSAAVRILDEDGVLFAQRGTTWQMGLSDVLVLGTHAGQ
ncbi:LpqB family beta-propeller domain-containing protein [Microbacterium aerolatum]|uniref:LpqB family beta-propeller domain-containing protein n=1 Tax=Microbacterium aerolatum TaxID=153731 RepID=UPI00384F592E